MQSWFNFRKAAQVAIALALVVVPLGGNPAAVAQDTDICSPQTTEDKNKNNLPDCLDACVVALLPDRKTLAMLCPDAFKIEADVGFESDKHRLWYGRFWTGQCVGLQTFIPDFCQDRGFHWANAMSQVLERVAPAKRNGLITEMWELGELIGREWSRNKDLRAIDLNMLRRWGDAMRYGEDVVATIEQISREAHAALCR